MLRAAEMLQKGLYQPSLGSWRPARRCHRMLRTAYHQALRREHLEKTSSSSVNGPKAFRTIFGRELQNPDEAAAISTPFGIVFIVSRRDYETVLPHSFSDGHYLLATHDQDKILPVENKGRVALVSTRHAYLGKPLKVVTDIARHEYEHLYLATTAFGRKRKSFADEILAPAGDTTAVQIHRLWDGSHAPQPTLEDITRKAQVVLEWWQEAFLEAVVKDELIAYCAEHLSPDEIRSALSFIIRDRFSPKFFSELNDFVVLHAQRTFGLTQRMIDCVVRCRTEWDQMDIVSYQKKAGDAGIAAIHKVVKAGVPLRVVLELAHVLALKDWPRKLEIF